MINVLKKVVEKMEIEKRDTEELRDLAKLFKQITDILNEVVDISDKLENNTLEISEEEANEKIEELLGRFIIQLLKINKKIGE
jgi:hypothetical protein|nr:MAG TPA: hypothetical protein [Caudoviricetes sp.]